MSEPIHCCFCGEALLPPSPLDNYGAPIVEYERINNEHVITCRIRRFNQACDAIVTGLMSDIGRQYDPILVIQEARALVEAIEKEAHEQK